jgi:hypothetical protein
MKVFEPYYRQVSIDACEIFKERTKSFLGYFIPGIYESIKDLFHPCPYEKVCFSKKMQFLYII